MEPGPFKRNMVQTRTPRKVERVPSVTWCAGKPLVMALWLNSAQFNMDSCGLNQTDLGLILMSDPLVDIRIWWGSMCTNHSGEGSLLWMDKILHHFETMVDTICFAGFYRGNRIIPGLLRWCKLDVATIHSISLPPTNMDMQKCPFQEERGLSTGFCAPC